MNRKNVAILGIIICSIYFIVTFGLIITSSPILLTAMELITMVSGLLMIMLVLVIPFTKTEKMVNYKIIATVFSAACMILTNGTHMVNLTVTEQLLKMGIDVPYYLQIGKWPSVEMAIDYLAWGLFMGLAFLFSFLGIEKEKIHKQIKITLCVNGFLCLVGFFGAILINQNIWYIAPMGYGLGTMLLCFELLILNKRIKLT
ncbi:hypothetical protein R2R35_02695 [Anaerocolumna sp. AGMB13020]|uniref:hypothetical protein n=1 Tax=Anaerocolumna sp. AGMB13020 TaxID=3081750 RepID=UPI002954B6E5|nr:hypothetical protein [Anaerocolumna sp. AGMB13020]WOO37421.1 hypothetical protein R2R35_02695 [Anaerocolumna sp. AGMB13020]